MKEVSFFWLIVGILIVLIISTNLPRILWELFKKLMWLVVVFAVLYFFDAFFLS